MTTYVDSSVLVAIYVPERFSKAARQVVRSVPHVPYTALHDLEVSNAFALLRGRGLITASEHTAVRMQVQEDVEAQRLVPVALDWADVFATATELSAAHTPSLLTRSLDVMHVAAARIMACRAFVSADGRQLAAAKASRLKILDIKRPARRAIPASR